MSQYVKLLQHNGGFISVLADDNGVIQYTTNDSDYSGISTGSVPAGSITNADLANMTAHTAKVRKTNTDGPPEDATMTELTALLNPATSSLQGLATAAQFLKLASLPSPWVTVGPTGGDATDVTLASGLDLDSAGGVEIIGYPAAGGTPNYFLRPNNSDTGCQHVTAVTTGTVNTRLTASSLFLVGSGGNTDAVWFNCKILGTSSLVRAFQSCGFEQTDPASYAGTGYIATSVGNITSLVIHASVASGIKTGSVFKYRLLNIT